MLKSIKKFIQPSQFILHKKLTTWSINLSRGSYLKTNDGESYLDFHGGYGSSPLGWNNPHLFQKMKEEDLSLFINKPANGDFPTIEYKDFKNTLKQKVIPQKYPWTFFIDGGALAVENALKVAFDWKTKINPSDQLGSLQIIHLERAFHGRSGYTMSLTNTDPHKIKYFPKFDWPRLNNLPYLQNLDHIEQKNVEEESIQRLHDMIKLRGPKNIAAMIIEPIQGEGGDRYFSKDYLQAIQNLCHSYNILFIVDEVQTGFYSTGKPWAFQHFDLTPDIVVFGKKVQQCGIFGGGERLNKINGGCFTEPGRISSTWSGNLVDMVRSKHIINIIQEMNLIENINRQGQYWLDLMGEYQERFPISNIRGKGLWMAFDMVNSESRNALLKIMKGNRLLGLESGEKSIRFRPNLAVKPEEIEECVHLTIKSLKKLDK